MIRPPFSKLWLPLLLGLTLAACTKHTDEDFLGSAREHLQKGDRKAAVIQLKAALQLAPQSGEARFLLGNALLETGDSATALVELRKAAELEFDETLLAPVLASAMLAQGESRQVIDRYAGRALSSAEANASLQSTLAVAYSRADQPEQAAKALEAALAAKPDHVPALLLKARLAASRKDFPGALSAVAQASLAEPTNAEAWLLKAEVQQRGLGDKVAALASYREAIKLRKELMPAHQAIVTLLLADKDVAGAKAHVAELGKTLPNQPATKLLQAQMAFLEKDYKTARDLALPLTRLAQNDPLVLQLAGAAQYQLGAVSQAEGLLAQAVKLAPGIPMASYLLARIYLRGGQADKALATIQPMISGPAPSAEAYLLAGEAHLQAGDAAQAEQAFARAAKLAPNSGRTRTALALEQFGKGNDVAGMAELESISASNTDATADMALVAAHLRQKDLPKALAAADQLVKKRPESAAAVNLRGRIQALKGDNANARASFEQAIKIDPRHFPAHISLAALDLTEKKPQAARKRFEDILRADPKNDRAMAGLAGVLRRSGGSNDEIARLLQAAVSANPNEVIPRLQLIEHFRSTGDVKAAFAAARDANAAIPNRRELLLVLGQVQLASNDHQQALTTFSQILTQQPDSALAGLGLAEAQIGMKDFDSAERQLRNLLKGQPRMAAAQRLLVSLYMSKDRYDDALKVAREARKQAPGNADSYLLEADIEVRRRNWDPAMAALKTALNKQASSIAASKLHAVLIAANRGAEAEKFAQSWQKDHTNDAAYRFYMADHALATKNWPLAEERYREVLRLQPKNALALNNVAWLMAKQSKPGASAMAEQANTLLPNQVQLLDTWALALASDKQVERALEMQRKTIQLAPQDPGLRLTLAKLYAQAGSKAEARAELQDLAKLGDKFREQDEVAELLKKL